MASSQVPANGLQRCPLLHLLLRLLLRLQLLLLLNLLLHLLLCLLLRLLLRMHAAFAAAVPAALVPNPDMEPYSPAGGGLWWLGGVCVRWGVCNFTGRGQQRPYTRSPQQDPTRHKNHLLAQLWK